MHAPFAASAEEHLAAVYARLVATYGPRTLQPSHAPVDELVITILSQNTTDSNSGRAFRALKALFPTWEAVIDAPVAELYAVIRPAGLGNIKAPRIQAILREILLRRGALNLDLLADLPLDAAKRWLTSLRGVGPKTAACVLLFALGRPALPVDTHVHRVAQRLGLIGPGINADTAHVLLERALPESQIYSFHIDMIQHGRAICHARRPACRSCPLRDLCASYLAARTFQ